MQEITLEVDNTADVVFQGEEVAKASDRSNDSTRWTELTAYRTNTTPERWVAYRCTRTLWEGEKDTAEAIVADSDEELIKQLGYSDLAKSIYSGLGIDARQRIT